MRHVWKSTCELVILTAVAFSALIGKEPNAALAQAASDTARVSEILRHYLAIPIEDGKLIGATRSERVDTLWDLRPFGELAAQGIVGIIFTAADSIQRLELAENLRWLPCPEAAAALGRLLEASDSNLRRTAAASLGALGARVSGKGSLASLPREPQRPARVDGIVPLLLKAASDPDTRVRKAAIMGLAGSRAAEAHTELLRLLQHQDMDTRLQAAVGLAGFDDASGFPILKAHIKDLHARIESRGSLDERDCAAACNCVPALERLSGEALGRMPLLPGLAPTKEGAEDLRTQYRALIRAWAEWSTAHP